MASNEEEITPYLDIHLNWNSLCNAILPGIMQCKELR